MEWRIAHPKLLFGPKYTEFYTKKEVLYRVSLTPDIYQTKYPTGFRVRDTAGSLCAEGRLNDPEPNTDGSIFRIVTDRSYEVLFTNGEAANLIVIGNIYGEIRFVLNGEIVKLDVYKRKYKFTLGGWDFDIKYKFLFPTESVLVSEKSNLEFPVAVMFLLSCLKYSLVYHRLDITIGSEKIV